MSNFMIGVLSSLVASIVILVGGWFTSLRLRRLFVRLFARLSGVDIERTFRTQSQASSALESELARAREVLVFVGRGNELTRKAFEPLWANAGNRLRSVRILLPDAEISTAGSWLHDRESETASHDTGYGDSLIADQVRANLRYIQKKVHGRPSFEVRLYDFPHLCRIVMTDRVAFFTPYTDTEHGSASLCILIRGPGPMFDFVRRIFEKAWKASRPDKPVRVDGG